MSCQRLYFILLPLILVSTSAVAGEQSIDEKCAAPPIKDSPQAICWGKYHVVKVWPQFDFSKMRADAKMQAGEVWSVWFIRTNPDTLGGGATLAIDSANGKLLEMWRGQ